MKTRKVALITVSVLIAICVLLSFSYAFYIITLSNRKDIAVSANIPSCAGVMLTSDTKITLTGDNTAPVSDAKALSSTNYRYSFTVSNGCSSAATMKVALAPTTTSTMSPRAIKYAIYESDGSQPSTGSFLSDNGKTLASDIANEVSDITGDTVEYGFEILSTTLNAGASKTYYVYVWVDKDEGGFSNNTTMDSTFYGHLVVTDYSSLGEDYIVPGVLSNYLASSNPAGYRGASHTDSATQNLYRFTGAYQSSDAGYAGNVDNYICLGSNEATCPADNMYRIIGVVAEDDATTGLEAGMVKVIKNTSIGIYTWDGGTGASDTNKNVNSSNYSTWRNNTTTSNYDPISGRFPTWHQSYLNTGILNTTYLNSVSSFSDKIASVKWHCYVGSSTLTAASEYSASLCSNTPSKISVIYAGDYLNAYNNGTNNSSSSYIPWIQINNGCSNSGTGNDYKYACGSWTMANFGFIYRSSSIYYWRAWYVYNNGSFGNNDYYFYYGYGSLYSYGYALRPVFYLTSDTAITGGSGTYADPYIVSSESSNANLISFTIDGNTYQADNGMTWQDWVNSSNNTQGYKVKNNKIYTSDESQYINVLPTATINTSGSYNLLTPISISQVVFGETDPEQGIYLYSISLSSGTLSKYYISDDGGTTYTSCNANQTWTKCYGTNELHNFLIYAETTDGGVTSIYNSSRSTGTCFTGDTKVKSENGYINIEDVKIGDKVYSYNEITKTKELKEVTKTFIHDDNRIYEIRVGNKIIKVTPDHRIYVKAKYGNTYNWTKVYNIHEGDYLLDSNNKEVRIDSIKYYESKEDLKVYNIEVEDNHTYYVSKGNYLVHNAKERCTDYENAGNVRCDN